MKHILLTTCLYVLVHQAVALGDYCDAESGCLEIAKFKSIPASVQTLSKELSNDPDIQSQLNNLADEATQVSSAVSGAISKDGSEILRLKNQLMTEASPNENMLNSMHTALVTTRGAFASGKDSVLKLQTNSQSMIETSRGRILRHEQDSSRKEAELQSIQGQINGIDSSIQTYEKDINDLEVHAKTFENRAYEIREDVSEKMMSGLFCGFVSVVLAPFTGGLSLVPGIIYAGVNFNDANDCARNAGSLRQDAATKRRHAHTLRKQRQKLVDQKTALEEEIRRIRATKAQLQEASVVLGDVTRFFLSAYTSFNTVIAALQDMDTALKDAQMQGDTFKILQAAFAANPEKLGASSQTHLDNLKKNWIRLEQILTAYGAR